MPVNSEPGKITAHSLSFNPPLLLHLSLALHHNRVQRGVSGPLLCRYPSVANRSPVSASLIRIMAHSGAALKIWIGFICGLALICCSSAQAAGLRVGFYKNSCPQAESLIQQAVAKKFSQTIVSAPGTLRLLFHDCMVRGCDGSVLLSSTAGNTAERDASENLSLPGDGFDTVVKAKAAVEQVCPGVVSCADVLHLAVRDLLKLVGGPVYDVETGRRDGRISLASEVGSNLPHANGTVSVLLSVFAKKGLDLNDLVTLSGGHSIGFVHCGQFTDRLYNFNSANKVDPALDANFAAALKVACPKNVDDRIVIDFDVTSPRKFDNGYYKTLRAHKGVLASDQVLFTDPRTHGLVMRYSKKNILFNSNFVQAITKLGRLDVKTGSNGEIRKFCDRVN